jgi:hypothetical protein
MPKDSLTIEGSKGGASDSPGGQTGRCLRVLVVAPSFDILGGQSVQAARLIFRLRELPFLEVGFLPINPRLPGILRWMQAIKYLRYFAVLLRCFVGEGSEV